jgi:hypothetical protein
MLSTSPMPTYTSPTQVPNFEQGFYVQFDPQKTCGSCGTSCDGAKSCHGCTVCNMCMADGEMCCFLCQHFGSDCQVETDCCKCGNCGSTCAHSTVCYSCSTKVCNTCMVAEEACCLLCLETFPTSPCFSPSSPSFQLNNNLQLADLLAPTIEHWEGQVSDQSPTATYQPQTKGSVEDKICSGHVEDKIRKGSGTGSAAESTCFEEGSDGSISSTDGTTMMIRNIPCRLSQNDVIEAINACGFADTYDFVYLPTGRHGTTSKGNLGYGFVNFKSSQHAEHFGVMFENFQFPGTSSSKKCTLKYAHLQGFNALYAAANRQPRGKRSEQREICHA